MFPKVKISVIESYIGENFLTYTEFCRRCNISLYTFNKIKKGENVRLNALFKIAREIKRQVADLFEECPDEQK